MQVKHINFNNFNGYLNNLYYYGGYGGMNWNDMYEVQSAFVSEHSWCDTGYNNVLTGQGEAITLGTGGFEAANLDRTFTLEKGTFASAWETNQPVYFNSYVYTDGQMTLKASEKVMLGQDAKTVNFAHYGHAFKNISEVNFISGVGQGGNTCSYGTPTYGYILVMDNLSLEWGRANGHSHGAHQANLAHRAMHHAAAHVAANFAPISSHDGANPGGQPANHASNSHDSPYHSQLSALPGHDPGGLTSQFTLPQIEHFGT